MTEQLNLIPVLSRIDLIADPVARSFQEWTGAIPVDEISVAEIDPNVADTAAFCDRYGWLPENSANCVIVAGKRGDEVTMAACILLATTRLDVNGVVRKRLEAKKASFASMDEAVLQTGMEYGGITPFGLPSDWKILVDSRVIERDMNVYGSGVRQSKIIAPGKAMLDLPNVHVVEDLASRAHTS